MIKNNKRQILRRLKDNAGSHSPSPKEIVAALGYNPIKHDFCFLSNPYATDLVVERFSSKFSEPSSFFPLLESYPASSKYVAKHIAYFEGLTAENMVVGNGAIQAIQWVCESWNLKNLLIPTPTFSTYYELLENKYSFTSEFWLSENLTAINLLTLANNNNCDSILLIQPNNPTGEALPISELKYLVENLEGKKLIIDESFSHFLSDYNDFKQFRNNLKMKDVVFIKSMSKDFGIAGLRLGYLYSFDEELLQIASFKTTWNLNNFSVLFSEFLGDIDFVTQYWNARIEYLNDKAIFFNDLNSIESLKVFPSQSNFFLMNFDSIKKPELVFDLLLDFGVYVRTMEDKIGLNDSYIRVASRRKNENILFINAYKNLELRF